MKTHFPSRELPHIWANQGAPYGRSPSNLSFEGDAISSYATVIGRRIRYRGKVAYVLDDYSFSNSTAKAQSRVSSAIPHGAQVFNVNGGWRRGAPLGGESLTVTPAMIRDHYLGRANEIAKAKPSRFAASRASALVNQATYLDNAVEVCTYFGLPCKAIQAKLTKLSQARHAANLVLEARRTVLSERQDAKRARQRESIATADRQTQEAAISLATRIMDGTATVEDKLEALKRSPFGYDLRRLKDRPDLTAAVHAFDADVKAKTVADWMAGDRLAHAPSDGPTLLRVEGGDMETSHGARVPLTDAERAYRFATARRAKGWKANGETCPVGMYHLDRINDEGIIAGCHRVSWQEADRFAAVMGWNAVPARA